MTDPFAMPNPPDDVERITAARMFDQALTEGHAPALRKLDEITARSAEAVQAIMEATR